MAHKEAGKSGSVQDLPNLPENHYAELIGSISAVVWEADPQTLQYICVSDGAETLLGYPVEEWTANPTFWTDHLHPEDRVWAIDARKADLKTMERPSYQADYRMLAADGKVVWVREMGTLIVEDGAVVKLAGILHEILERTVRHDNLLEKEEQYRLVFEATSDGLVINDTEGNVVGINPAFARMHGYEVEEMVGMDPRKFVHPDYHSHLQSFFETVRQGNYFHTQAMDVRKDGTSFHVQVNGVPFQYNGKPHILGVLRDITAQVEAYEMLRLKEEQYRAVWEVTSDGLVIADRDGKVVDVNPAWCRMLGYGQEEIVDLIPPQYVHPDSEAVFADYFEKVKVAGKFQSEAQVIRKDGTPFHIEMHASPIIYNGKPHTLTVFRDITERVQSYELLEQRVEERTRELAALLEVSNNVTSPMELEPLLKRILEQLKEVVDYSRASIAIGLDSDSVVSVWGDPSRGPVPIHTPVDVSNFGKLEGKLAEGEPILIADIQEKTPEMIDLRKSVALALMMVEDPLRQQLLQEERAFLIVPLRINDATVGGLTLRHTQPGYYNERHARLALGISNQASIVIENGRLLAQAHEKAALEERQRLARELHDSVTQSLFSINLIARSVEVMLQREGSHSPDAMEKMADLRHLTQGALAEMRALIFELRPGALVEEGLIQAIRKHAAAVQGREELQVEVYADEAAIPRLKPRVEEDLYRIAQESLHNIVKHAKATRAELSLVLEEDSDPNGCIVLTVKDNGKGFNIDEVPAGHMGLGTMNQRAMSLLGTCTIESAPGKGTTVTTRIPLANWLPDGPQYVGE